MPRALGLVIMILGLAPGLGGCPKRDLPPESSYDPALLETARQVAEQENQSAADDKARRPDDKDRQATECTRDEGGCPDGSLCWDSWYCKQGRPDQCSAQGDMRCHKRCTDDSECPEAMPACVEKPIFKGSDRGVLEKFCVAGE